jgi:glycosyltransferase involved in cell wall biosynthesis
VTERVLATPGGPGGSSGSRHVLVLNERDIRHPRAGGAEVHCFEVCRRLVARGDRVTLFATRFAGAPAEETVDGVRVFRFGNPFTYYARVPWAYAHLRRRDTVDVVVEDLNKFPYFARLWVREPVVVFVHHLWGSTAFRQVAAPIALAVVAAEWLVKRLYRDIPVIAVSPSTREELLAAGLRTEDVHLVPNGIDHERYRPGGDGPESPPLVFSLGRVEPYKNVERVAEAVAGLPDVRLVIAGRGTAFAALERRVAELALGDRVELLGFVSEDEKIRLLREAWVHVVASDKEGWGITVIEAAACGTPTVASAVPGLRDAVRDGETGLLVPPGDVAALREAIDRVCRDTELRRRLAAAGRDWASRFTWDAAAGVITRIIDDAVACRAR